MQRLEEASISCKGPERVQLMKRWLAALKAIDNMSEVSVEDKEKNNEQQHPSEEVRKQPLVSSLISTAVALLSFSYYHETGLNLFLVDTISLFLSFNCT